MARTKKTPFAPWQTCKESGIEERYIRLGNSQLLHPAMLDLSDKARTIYIYMLLESGGKREFTFPRSKYSKIAGHTVFQNAKDELLQKGFIRVKQNNANLRKANIYEFSDGWKRIEPP